jgi:formate hydrogenlyase transcriptional activator
MNSGAQLQTEEPLQNRYEALLKISRGLRAHEDCEGVFRTLVSALRPVIRFDYVSVVLFDETNPTTWWMVVDAADPSGVIATPPDAEPELSKWVFERQQALVIPSLLENRFSRTVDFLKRYGIQSTCTLPLTTVHSRLGSLEFGCKQLAAYAEQDLRFLSLVADQVALAIDDTLNLEASQAAQADLGREKDRLKLLLEVTNSVVSNLELRTLLRIVAATVRRVMECDLVGVDLPDAQAGQLRIYALDFPESRGLLKEEGLVPIEGTPPGQVFQTGKPLVLRIDPPDPATSCEGHRIIAGEGIKIGCLLPLTCCNRTLGVLALGRREENAFTQDDVDFLMQVASQVAIAVDNALAYGQTAELKERLRALLEVSEAIAVNRDLNDLFRELAQRLPRVVPFDVMNLVLHDPVANVMRLQLVIGPESKSIKPGLEVPVDESATGIVWKTQQPLMVEDVAKETRFPMLTALLLENGVQSFCTVPLTTALRRLGAMNFATLQKRTYQPAEIEFMQQVAKQVATAVDNALAYGQIAELQEKLAREKLYLEDEIRNELNFDEIIGKSEALRQALKQVETVAPTESTVLIYGETGTGKELVARAVHDLSPRRASAFVKLNCAAIPTGLLESELFGHEKGAFTGAIAQRIGRFELAHRGTVFLDEVGEIPLELQPKLLRVLQEREFERLGSSRTLRTEARLIAATNRDLATMVDEQKFRSDLFYRLNVFPVRVPPLRERSEDIPLLVRHFAEQFARRMNKTIERIPSDTMSVLCDYHWPGNIRELQNVVERAVILSTGPVLNVSMSALRGRPTAGNGESRVPTERRDMRNVLEDAERKHILDVLQETGWVVAGPNGAAIRLGMKRSTLQLRMRKLGISRSKRPA